MNPSYLNAIPVDLLSLVLGLELRLDQIFSLAKQWPAFAQAIKNPSFWETRYLAQFHQRPPFPAIGWYTQAYQLFDDYMNGRGDIKGLDLYSFDEPIHIWAKRQIKEGNKTILNHVKGLSLMMKLGLVEEAEQFLLKHPNILKTRYIDKIEAFYDQLYNSPNMLEGIFAKAGMVAAKNGHLDIAIGYRPCTNYCSSICAQIDEQ